MSAPFFPPLLLLPFGSFPRHSKNRKPYTTIPDRMKDQSNTIDEKYRQPGPHVASPPLFDSVPSLFLLLFLSRFIFILFIIIIIVNNPFFFFFLFGALSLYSCYVCVCHSCRSALLSLLSSLEQALFFLFLFVSFLCVVREFVWKYNPRPPLSSP